MRKSGSFDTKAQAKAWAAKIETDMVTDLVSPGGTKTVADAFARYGNEVSVEKKGKRYEQKKLNAFTRDHFARIKLSELAPTDIADWRDSRLKKVSPASVNRELNLISAVLSTAKRDWGGFNRTLFLRLEDLKTLDLEKDAYLKLKFKKYWMRLTTTILW
jgi:hypothetical protein